MQHLLRILLMYELESSKVAPFWWAGKFSAQGEAVIAQHSAQSGLTCNDCALAQWSAFTTVHSSHSLAFKLFEKLLEKLLRHIQTAELTSDELKMFWEGVRKLLPSCFSVLRNIRKRTAGDKNSVKILNEVVSIISIVGKLTPPAEFDLFPRNVYGYLSQPWPTGNFMNNLFHCFICHFFFSQLVEEHRCQGTDRNANDCRRGDSMWGERVFVPRERDSKQ